LLQVASRNLAATLCRRQLFLVEDELFGQNKKPRALNLEKFAIGDSGERRTLDHHLEHARRV
jgi:hypothetical protein